MTTTCEHRQVLNATWECRDCGTKMVAQRREPQHLTSGSSPDARTFLEGFHVRYDCDRCNSVETPGCGRTHIGEYLNAAGKSRRD
ncbi:DUF7459 domain-containing protein [Mycobacterium sp. Root265]|uniref:DUF7459 domain-containing protein n=1 Tax=Mycobacterium sp. Root265 TaxID=1736504 RepID=UPI003FA5F3CC